MLGLKFQLTPFQTKLIVEMRAGVYRSVTGDRYGLPGSEQNSYFVTSMKSLGAKNIIEHNPYRDPTYMLTREGEAIADLITKYCEGLVEISKKRRVIKPRMGKLVNNVIVYNSAKAI